MNNEQDTWKPLLAAIGTILLLPTLIIAAVPNIFFSYDNSASSDVMAMTEKTYSIDAGKLVAALKEGKLVIAIMAKGHFTRSGHFIVLRGVTSDGKILVADPSSLKRSNQEWNLSIITNEARRDAAAGGPFWTISPI